MDQQVLFLYLSGSSLRGARCVFSTSKERHRGRWSHHQCSLLNTAVGYYIVGYVGIQLIIEHGRRLYIVGY
jgi:hypothetical protein